MVNKKGKTLSGYTYHTSVHNAKKRNELKKEFRGKGYNVRTKKNGKNYDIFTKKTKKTKKAELARIAKRSARIKRERDTFEKEQAKLHKRHMRQVNIQYLKQARKSPINKYKINNKKNK